MASSKKGVDPSAIEAEVVRVGAMNKAELRSVWRAKYKSDPPRAFGPDLLRRSVAYRIQEEAYGGLSSRTKRELDQLIALLAKKPTSRIELPRRIQSGAVLIREWKGKVFRVTVLDDRFLFEGSTYSSLSEIASLITGTKWNGPRFFGLRPNSNTKPATDVSGAEAIVGQRRRGRPPKRGRESTVAPDQTTVT
jgi:hypothetical protein